MYGFVYRFIFKYLKRYFKRKKINDKFDPLSLSLSLFSFFYYSIYIVTDYKKSILVYGKKSKIIIKTRKKYRAPSMDYETFSNTPRVL